MMAQVIIAQRCDFKPGDDIDGCYQVRKSLGEGAFGKVYCVVNRAGKVYALKLLKLWEVDPLIREQLVTRFDMEFETGQIHSNYLVHSIDHGVVEGNPYIVMEYCSQGDLLGCMEKAGTDWVGISRQVLYGLRDLHRCGKVHRDLKPENVLIKDNGVAALTDFGISGDRNKRMTERNILGKPRQIFGTYAYMPPEQVKRARGEATVLPTTDIFSFGVMMYQLLTAGNLPFGPLENQNDLVGYLKNGELGQWDRGMLNTMANGDMWTTVLEGCLVPDFRARLQSADHVLKLLPAGMEKEERQPDFSFMTVVHGIQLRVMQGEEYGRVYRLDDVLHPHTFMLTMGREEQNSLCIKEEESLYISRWHCTLEKDVYSGQWYIRDGQWHATDGGQPGYWKNSLNGTYVNSTPVAADGMVFGPGDIISVGDVKLRVEGY